MNSQNAAASSAELAQEAAQKASFDNIGDIKYTSRTDVPNGGVWCDGAEYTQAQFPDVYQMLVDGKLSYTNYSIFNNSVSTNGYCALFALDSSAQKFKVPKLLDKYVMDLADDVPVVGNGMALGFSDGNNNLGAVFWNSVNYNGNIVTSSMYGVNVGDVWSEVSTSATNKAMGITTDPEKSGMIADTSNLGKTVTLKAYVVLYSSAAGASEVQAAEFIQGLSGKANTDLSNVSSNIDYVVESYRNGTEWYRIYKSGWVEQGGATSSRDVTVTFPRPFKDTSYTIVGNSLYDSVLGDYELGFINKTNTSIRIYLDPAGSVGAIGSNWQASGQGA